MYNAKLSSKSSLDFITKLGDAKKKQNTENFCYSDECREDFKRIPFR